MLNKPTVMKALGLRTVIYRVKELEKAKAWYTKAFRTKPLDTDDSYSFTFTKAGEFAYICGLHPFMTGKVIVTP